MFLFGHFLKIFFFLFTVLMYATQCHIDMAFGDDVLHKSTFSYLLTYLLIYLQVRGVHTVGTVRLSRVQRRHNGDHALR